MTWFINGKEYFFDLMRRKLKSKPGIDEKKLSWTFSIVLFWQDVYSLSPCGPVGGLEDLDETAGCCKHLTFIPLLGTLPTTLMDMQPARSLKVKLWGRNIWYWQLHIKISCDEMWMGIKWIYFTWQRVSQNEGWHRRVSFIKVRFMMPLQRVKKKRLISFSYVFSCH